MMTAIASLLVFGGFAAMSLGMARHHEDAFGGEPGRLRAWGLHGTGWVALALALWALVLADGWSEGLTTWFGILTVAGLVLIGLMPYAPRLAAKLGAASLALALLLSLLNA
ncbi:FIG016502: iron uptake protein [plant metagenome]|uniref:FIG016502: iron uptake protein n=1 Tax=plant metagenome TaxID=1297885 RepID=A0A484Q2H8_9ZZZZ